MTEIILNTKQIAIILKISPETIREYLGRFTFDKYTRHTKVGRYYQRAYVINKDFINDFNNFLLLKRKQDCIKRLNKFWESEKDIMIKKDNLEQQLIEAHLENKRLQDSLDMISKQYNNLLKHHNECLKAFKEEKENINE